MLKERLQVPEIAVRYASRFGLMVVFAGLAIVAAGCSDSRLAANNAASNGGQVQQSGYQVGYGLSSEGTTTDLYHGFKHSLEPPERPQATAAIQQPAPLNGPQVADSAPGPGAASQPGAAGQPGAASQQPVAQQPVAQQPAAPPREAPTATMYGMNSDGPSTDIYTALFGRQ
jgi:hypothetical protein